MKKFLKITTIDGTEHLMPFQNQKLGEALNSPNNIGLAVNVARSGFCLDEKATEPVIIAPSQIKSVQLIQKLIA